MHIKNGEVEVQRDAVEIDARVIYSSLSGEVLQYGAICILHTRAVLKRSVIVI